MNFVLGIAKFFNTINSNVWAVIVLLVGVFLVIRGEKGTGESLVTGGFALLRSTVTVGEKGEGKDVETKIE